MDSQDRTLIGGVGGFVLAIALVWVFSIQSFAPEPQANQIFQPVPREALPVAAPASPIPAPAKERAGPSIVAAPLPANRSLAKAPAQEAVQAAEPPKDVAQVGAQKAVGAIAITPAPSTALVYRATGPGAIEVILPFGVASVVAISISLFIRRKLEPSSENTESGK